MSKSMLWIILLIIQQHIHWAIIWFRVNYMKITTFDHGRSYELSYSSCPVLVMLIVPPAKIRTWILNFNFRPIPVPSSGKPAGTLNFAFSIERICWLIFRPSRPTTHLKSQKLIILLVIYLKIGSVSSFKICPEGIFRWFFVLSVH